MAFIFLVTASTCKPQCLSLSLVATATDLHLIASEPLPTIWRRGQLSFLKRRRYLHDGWFDQQLDC